MFYRIGRGQIRTEQKEIIMGKIAAIEYFRVPPRWLFVKIMDQNDQAGWGEGTLEGHTLAVEGALDELKVRLIGLEAK